MARKKLTASDSSIYELLTKYAHDAVTVIEEDVVVWVSPAYQRIFGYSPEETVGRKLSELVLERIHPKDFPLEQSSLKEKFRQPGGFVRYAYRSLHKDGHYLWIEDAIHITCYASGEVQRMVVNSRDIQELKQAEERLKASEERWQMAVEGSRDGIWDLNLLTGGLYLSSRCADMLGYTMQQLDSIEKWLALVHPEDKSAVTDCFDEYLAGKALVYIGEYRMLTSSGKYKWVLSRGKAIWANGRAVRATGSLSDIDDRKQQEVRLKKQARELKRAREKAEAASHTKSVFLANMSHEIRTPLNAVIGYAELMESQLDNKLHAGYARAVKTSGKVLLSLMNDLLDFSKIEAGKLELKQQYVCVQTLFRELQEIFMLSASQKQLDFSVHLASSVPAVIETDKTRLRQVLINIIGNAIKFTETGFVKVSTVASPAATRGYYSLEVSVQDSGPGIPADEQENIFKPFVQQPRQKQRHGGTGLGLAISRQITEMAGGTILLQSSPGEGSTFKLYFPAVKAPGTVQAGAEPAGSGSRLPDQRYMPARVLVADPVEANGLLVIQHLKDSGLDISRVSKGEQAIAAAARLLPDIVLLETGLPDLPASQVLRRIKENPSLAHTRVLAITASAPAGSTGDDTASSTTVPVFDGYLLKPFTPGMLHNSLAAFLPRMQKEQATLTQWLKGLKTGENVNREALPRLKLLLDNDIRQDWKLVSSTPHMDHVEAFALQLKAGAKQSGLLEAERFADKLFQAASTYDIQQTNNLLQEFSALLQHLDTL